MYFPVLRRQVSLDGEFGLRLRLRTKSGRKITTFFTNQHSFLKIFTAFRLFFSFYCYICSSKPLHFGNPNLFSILMSLTIYKASAGSGKTFILSATYIANLIADETDSPHKHQLAVTFTNKATAEMKERILQYLYALANDMPETDGFFKEIRKRVPGRMTNAMIRVRAKKALLDIIHNYDHFHVTTIDSFFQSLLGNLAHELSLSSSFKVEISDIELLSKAVDTFLNNVTDGSAELSWLTQYIKEKMSDDKNWNVTEELKSLAKQITKEKYMLHSPLLNKESHPELEGAVTLTNELLDSYKSALYAHLSEALKTLEENAIQTCQEIENSITFANIYRGGNVRKGIEKIQNACAEGHVPEPPSDAFMKYVNGEAEYITKTNQKKKPELLDMVDDFILTLRDFMNKFQQAMTTIHSCQLSLKNLNPLRLLNAINQVVNNINLENDRILLAYTPLLFHKLADGVESSFVFERAGTTYRHIMIDEFQDTSYLQWANMSKLLIENMANNNDCMLVGDVKQGIYRFRGGDWNTLASFGNATDEDDSSINIKTLDTNFRSGEAIVRFNNRFFTHAPAVFQDYFESDTNTFDKDHDNSDSLDITRIYPEEKEEDEKHEVTQNPHAEGGYVRVQFLNNHDRKKKEEIAAEAEHKEAKTGGEDGESEDREFCREESVAEQMLLLNQKGVPYNEMAILIRNNFDAAPLLEYFEEHHGKDSEHPIALMSEEAFLLESSPAVMTIINALRYISNPTDLIAREYLRMQCPVSTDFSTIIDTLETWNKNKYSGLPFYEITCRLADMFALHDRVGQSPYIYCFLDAVLAFVDDHTASVKTFLDYWDESLHKKSIPSAAADGVRILTIHKSKGLAFHTVFIPYCDWAITKPSLIPLEWIQPKEEPFNQIPFLPIELSKDALTSIYSDEFRQERFDSYVENLNLIYVAFTRPKQNLLVWIDCNSKKSVASIGPILRDAFGCTGELLEEGTPSKLFIKKKEKTGTKSSNPLEFATIPITVEFTHHKPQLLFQQSNNATHFLNDKSEITEPDEVFAESAIKAKQNKSELQEQYRMTGIVLHSLMREIEHSDEVEAKMAEFVRQGKMPTTLNPDSLTRLIKRRMSHPIAREWYDGSWMLYSECSIVYKDPTTGLTTTKRPDRVMFRGSREEGTYQAIVIDFKFGQPKPEYTDQVQEYMDLLTRQGVHNVKGYLWYLYTGIIDEVG